MNKIYHFNSMEEIEKYYDLETGTYVFKEDGNYIPVVCFHFNFFAPANIDAYNIDAYNICAHHIKCNNLNALNIQAYSIDARWDITYYAVCFAYGDIKCTSISGGRHNARYFSLDGIVDIRDV